MEIRKISPIELLNDHRFDILIKIAYAECAINNVRALLNCGNVYQAYIDHIDVFNSFEEPGTPDKNSKEKFIEDFNNIIFDIANGTFDWKKSPIPVDFSTMKIVGGAHRLAAAIACGLEEVAICDAYSNGHIGVRHVYYDGILNGIEQNTIDIGMQIAENYNIQIEETSKEYKRRGNQKQNNKNFSK